MTSIIISMPPHRESSGEEVEAGQERSTTEIDHDYWWWTRHTVLSWKVRCYAGIILVYYVVGIAVYSTGACQITNHKVSGDEKIKDVSGVDEAIYFITVMLTSVGFGDIVPDGEGSRLFTTFYALVGLVVIGIPILELAERLKLEKVRAIHRAKSRAVKQAGADLDTKGNLKRRNWMRRIPKFKCGRLATFAVHPITVATAKIVTLVVWYSIIFYLVARSEGWSQDLRGSRLDNNPWSYTDALYFTVITTTTIGYGDLVPKTDSGKWLVVFIMPVGIIYVSSSKKACNFSIVAIFLASIALLFGQCDAHCLSS